MELTKILLVDDDDESKKNARNFLENITHVSVVGDAIDSVDALKKIEAHLPDVVLINNDLQTVSVGEVVYLIKQRFPLIKVVIVTSEGSVNYSMLMDSVKADGFILKSSFQSAH